MRSIHIQRALAISAAVVVGIRLIARLRLRASTFDDEVVFITGGSRGLGLAIAFECARRGARVVLCGRDEQRLRAAAARFDDPGRVSIAVADIRFPAAITEAVRQTHARFGRLDMLVNNAGIIAVGPAQSSTRLDYEEALETHFWAMYHAVEAARPLMRAQGGGRIVNISSIGGKISVPHLLPYSVSKFAAVGYSEGLRAELAPDRISVTTVCPGLMRTGSPRNAFFKGQNTKEYAWFTLSDTLPGLSIAASTAARSIVEAAIDRRAELVLSIPAQLAVLAHGIAPGFVANVLGLVNRMLPGPGGVGRQRVRGYESESAVTLSALTVLGRKAEREYNQL